jgi:alpha-beta hydrolase superfamily lysophospholipase
MDPKYAFKISKMMTVLGLGHVNTRSGSHWKPPFERNVLTHSGEFYEVIQNSPYPVPSPTFEWVKATWEATQRILEPESLKKLTMPILVLCGTDEAVVDINAIKPWIDVARQHAKGPIDLHWIQGGRHELFYESKAYFDKARIYTKEWFNKVGFPI